MSFTSNRVSEVPPYVFSEINRKKAQLKQSGVDVIDLGIGDPDLPTPQPVVDRLIKEMGDPMNFKYSNYSGCLEFRKAVSSFYKKQYDVSLDPETEVLALIGSKEGIAHLVLALIDAGDYVLTPDPSYGVYRMATILAGGCFHNMPLAEQNHFKPDFSALPKEIKQKAKLMFLNYPGNPTAATADLAFFKEAIQFAKENEIPIAHDFAYNTITFEDHAAPSILQADGAKDMAVEFGSLSKSYNMTGWRIGYVVGNKEIIHSLSVVKSNTDTSQFLPIQKAAAFALSMDQTQVKENVEVYRGRMLAVVDGLKSIGIPVGQPKGTFYVWAPVPEGYSSGTFAADILECAGVVVTPGAAFGPSGEGYFRISLTHPVDRLKEAIERIQKSL